MISLTTDNRMLGYELLSKYPNILHFVTTRRGGCSQGNYATFNCTSYTGDNEQDVLSNQQLLQQSFPDDMPQLVIPRQVHNTEVRLIKSADDCRKEALEGVDALIAHLPGYCLCISTADCVPLLIYDTKQKVIAAVHAGWRGTVQGIVTKTLQQMQQEYQSESSNLMVCIGPSISVDAFEVGDEVYGAFRNKGYDMPRIAMRNEKTAKHHIDLWEANRQDLLAFGIPHSQIECAGICTYQNYEEFFSARRLGIHSGRILSGIMIKK